MKSQHAQLHVIKVLISFMWKEIRILRLTSLCITLGSGSLVWRRWRWKLASLGPS